MSDGNITMTPASVPMKKRNTRKKDRAPRGVFRHRSDVWAVRFTCAGGHIHQARVGLLRSDAVRVYHERRALVLDEPARAALIARERIQSDLKATPGAATGIRSPAGSL